MCPGDVNKTFMENLLFCFNSKTDQVIKIDCAFEPSELVNGLDELMRMNKTEESLFPGLDGLAMSMNYKMWFYSKMSAWRQETK